MRTTKKWESTTSSFMCFTKRELVFLRRNNEKSSKEKHYDPSHGNKATLTQESHMWSHYSICLTQFFEAQPIFMPRYSKMVLSTPVTDHHSIIWDVTLSFFNLNEPNTTWKRTSFSQFTLVQCLFFINHLLSKCENKSKETSKDDANLLLQSQTRKKLLPELHKRDELTKQCFGVSENHAISSYHKRNQRNFFSTQHINLWTLFSKKKI